MGERRPSQTRRVSFAAEPQVQYIPANRYDSSKASSSVHDAPMDMTTEIPEFKNLFLFQKIEAQLPDDNLDDVFSKDTTVDTCDDSMEASEYVRRLSISARRNSLDVINNRSLVSLAASKDVKEEGPNGEVGMVVDVSGDKGKEEKENGVAEGKRHVESNCSDMILSNSSYVVEELINTVDLRTILPQVKKESQDLNEFLASAGIRFLDDAIIGSLRRDTLSKSRNVVDPSLFYYYKYSMKERIEFFQMFSSFLGEKMCDLQAQIVAAQSSVDIPSLNKEKLKRIRNESRNRARVDWYTLRKINELQFNKKIVQHKFDLEEQYETRIRELEDVEGKIESKRAVIADIKAKVAGIQQRLASKPQGHLEETEKLLQMIEDRKKLLESIREEHRSMLEATQESSLAISRVDAQIEKLKAEIELMKKNFLTRGVTEAMLEEARSATKRFSLLFDFKIMRLSEHVITFLTHGSVITLYYERGMIVSKLELTYQEPDTPFPAIPVEKVVGKDLRAAILSIVSRLTTLKTILKDLEVFRGEGKVEYFSQNTDLHFRLNFLKHGKIVDFVVDEKYNVCRDKSQLFNFLESPFSLREHVLKEIEMKGCVS